MGHWKVLWVSRGLTVWPFFRPFHCPPTTLSTGGVGFRALRWPVGSPDCRALHQVWEVVFTLGPQSSQGQSCLQTISVIQCQHRPREQSSKGLGPNSG
jgi:hypothetical protein